MIFLNLIKYKINHIMDDQSKTKSYPDNKQRKVSGKLSSGASMSVMGLLGLGVLLKTEGMGVQANLLEEGIASGSPLKLFTGDLRGYEYAINSVYECANNGVAGIFIQKKSIRGT